jgi:hypothetical protein
MAAGEIEMSIEETNKLRISLGLKPLVITPPDEKKKKDNESKKAEKERQQNLLRDKIKK